MLLNIIIRPFHITFILIMYKMSIFSKNPFIKCRNYQSSSRCYRALQHAANHVSLFYTLWGYFMVCLNRYHIINFVIVKCFSI